MGVVVGYVLAFQIARDGHDSANVLFLIVGAVLVVLGTSAWRNPTDPSDFVRGGIGFARVGLSAFRPVRDRRLGPAVSIGVGLLLIVVMGINILGNQDLFGSDAPTGGTVTIGGTTSSPTARP